MTTPCSFEEQPKKATITATTRPVAAVTVAIIDLFISRVSIGLPRYLLPYARSSNSAAAVSLEPNTDGVGFHQGVVGAIVPVFFATAAYVFHLPPKLKSSNNVTLSAFVQTPPLPASEKLVSSASITLVPSKLTVK